MPSASSTRALVEIITYLLDLLPLQHCMGSLRALNLEKSGQVFPMMEGCDLTVSNYVEVVWWGG